VGLSTGQPALNLIRKQHKEAADNVRRLSVEFNDAWQRVKDAETVLDGTLKQMTAERGCQPQPSARDQIATQLGLEELTSKSNLLEAR